MKRVLSEEALRELNEHGFVRTGIRLPVTMVDRLLQMYRDMPASASNWRHFGSSAFWNYCKRRSLSHYSEGGVKGLKNHFARKWKARSGHRGVPENFYDKSIFGSSKELPLVLRECLERGLARCLGDIPLLVGHDIYLESDRNKKMFGYHEDSFAWEIFFQTEDDVTFYIPLTELNENTGGRLIVDRHRDRNDGDGNRSEWIARFADFCRKHHAIDHRSLVTRQSVQNSRYRRVLATELNRLLFERRATASSPEPDDMIPVDSARGEVIIFNNKRFHNVEPWTLDVHRTIYIVRCIPLYDLGLAPPSTFLNDVACNRYILDGCNGTLKPADFEKENPRFVPIPS